eukprot:364354-Chlamydomonas_euryale.AAC.14
MYKFVRHSAALSLTELSSPPAAHNPLTAAPALKKAPMPKEPPCKGAPTSKELPQKEDCHRAAALQAPCSRHHGVHYKKKITAWGICTLKRLLPSTIVAATTTVWRAAAEEGAHLCQTL